MRYPEHLAVAVEALQAGTPDPDIATSLAEHFPGLSQASIPVLLLDARECIARAVSLREPDSIVHVGTELWALVELAKAKGDFATAQRALTKYAELKADISAIDHSFDDIAVSLARLLGRAKASEVADETLVMIRDLAAAKLAEQTGNGKVSRQKRQARADICQRLAHSHTSPVRLGNGLVSGPGRKTAPARRAKATATIDVKAALDGID